MRTPAVVLAVALLLTACAHPASFAEGSSRACELLATETEITLVPPTDEPARMSLGEALVSRRPGVPFDVAVYLEPERAAELEAVEREVGLVTGVEVVAVLDQEAMYAEFLELFADREDLIDSATPRIMPPSIRATVTSEDQVEALATALGEGRIYDIVYEAGLHANTISVLVDRFSDEFEELERITSGNLQEAIVVIRSDDPTPGDLREARAVLADFLEEKCTRAVEVGGPESA